MGFIEDLNWRYATKQFDASKKITPEQLNDLKEAARLSVSSYGLQSNRVVIVENQELRDKLVEHSWGQRQVADASHLFVICSNTNVTEAHIEEYINLISDVREIPVEALQDFANMMKNSLLSWSDEMKTNWLQKQCYIVMTNILNAAATLRVDACPMEGFIPEKYNEILGLNELGLHATVVVPVGYRHEDDAYQHFKKVRKPQESFFHIID